MSRLIAQLDETLAALSALSPAPALIGGLAVTAHRVPRSTQDIDLLVDAEHADRVAAAMLALGYRCLHRSEDAANYVRADERVDFLFARRPLARAFLRDADCIGERRVVQVEALIAFKLQALVNDPRRHYDRGDLVALLRNNRERLDMARIRDYFALFERAPLLDELLAEAAP